MGREQSYELLHREEWRRVGETCCRILQNIRFRKKIKSRESLRKKTLLTSVFKASISKNRYLKSIYSKTTDAICRYNFIFLRRITNTSITQPLGSNYGKDIFIWTKCNVKVEEKWKVENGERERGGGGVRFMASIIIKNNKIGNLGSLLDLLVSRSTWLSSLLWHPIKLSRHKN